MFVRNAWYVAGFGHELEPGKLLPRTFLGERVVMYRKADGSVAALSDRCPHRFVPLHIGKVKGDVVQCGYHGLEFGADGVCTHNPHGDGKIAANMKVRAYALEERDSLLWIWMGRAEEADTSAILRFPEVTGDGYKTVYGSMNVGANYQLVNDNLLDLSHTQFVHPIFQVDDDQATAKVFLEPEETSGQERDLIWSKTLFKNVPLHPFAALYDDRPLADNFVDTYWHAPSIIFLHTGTRAPGARPGEGQEVSTPSRHMLTPETEGSTHYFWTMTRNVKLDDEALSAIVYDGVTRAFAGEDKPIIEMQQRELGDVDLMTYGPVLLQTDKIAVRARRMVADMLAAEAKAPAAAE
jgi:vanillate O-demethylase monooxygenase subunit